MMGCIYGMVQKTKTAISILQQRGEENSCGQSHNAAAGEQIRIPGVYDSRENMGKQKVDLEIILFLTKILFFLVLLELWETSKNSLYWVQCCDILWTILPAEGPGEPWKEV